MKPMHLSTTRVLPAFFLLALLLIVWPASVTGGQHQFAFQSPIPAPLAPTPSLFSSPLPTPPAPVPTPIPDEVQLALRYAIDQLGIPASQLLVDHHYRQDYPELGRSFTAVTLLDIGRDRFFTLLVDLKDHSVEANMKAVEDAEAQARRARYGKLEPALHARLQQASDEELVDVAIWIAGKPPRDQRERYLALAAQFPQARESIERYGTPFYQADPALSVAIQQAYEDMLREDVQASLNPLIMHLQELKYTPAIVPGLPAVMIKLPKREIVELSRRSDVGRIFLAERPAGPALDAAVPSDRIPSLWQQQVGGLPLDGEGGTRIGIVEGGTADIYSRAGLCASIPCFRHPGGVSGGFGDDWNYQHATLVASAAASDYVPRRGAAPGATIYSARMVSGSDWALIDALHRALGAGWYNVDVANVSWQSYCQQDMAYPDFAFDYWAREYRRTITVAAGNYDLCNDYNLRSPGKAWNVITVGAYDDHNNSDWSDDSMWSGSTYIDPFGDREKPEVAASGANIEGIGRNGILIQGGSGTSYAAPLVAGLADLLIQRSSRLLRDFPTAVKAIIMAAAVHNIEGDSRLSDRDGAGGIDAALAEKAAGDSHPTDATVCTGPCWWNVEFNDQALPDGSRVAQRYFRASRGERVRVAIAWMSFAYCPPNESYCPVDNSVNLDLEAFKPTDPTYPIATSASVSNNYEIVEFTAPDNGQYEIRVNKSMGGTGEAINWLGIAWVKDATYLADLRNVNGWASEIYVRNEGAEPLNALVHYFDPGGGATPKVSDTCYLVSNQQCWIPVSWDNRIPAGTLGTAIVGGGEEIDVAVLHYKANGLDADNGLQAGGSSDRAFAQAATYLYAPAVYSNIFAANSVLQVRFNGAVGNQVDFLFRGRSPNYPDVSWSTGVPANSRLDVFPSQFFGTNAWVGSVRVSSNQPLAVDVLDTFTDGHTRTANAAAGGATTLYAAALYRAAYNLTSGIVVQNIGTAATVVELRFCNRPGTVCTPYLLNNGNPLDPARAAGVYLSSVPGLSDGWTGSARILSSSGQPLAASIQADQPGVGDFAYNAASVPVRTILLPRAAKNYDGRTTSYLIQNASATSALQVTATYYDEWGNPTGSPVVYPPLAPLASMGRYQGDDTQLPVPWRGSIVLTADGPWAVAVARENSSNSMSAASGIPR